MNRPLSPKPSVNETEITKTNNSYNEYKLVMSYGELEAIRDALAVHHAGPISDELYNGILWHLDRLPMPGQDDEKKEDKSGSPPEPRDVKTISRGGLGVKRNEEDDVDVDTDIDDEPKGRGPVKSEQNLDDELPEPEE